MKRTYQVVQVCSCGLCQFQRLSGLQLHPSEPPLLPPLLALTSSLWSFVVPHGPLWWGWAEQLRARSHTLDQTWRKRALFHSPIQQTPSRDSDWTSLSCTCSLSSHQNNGHDNQSSLSEMSPEATNGVNSTKFS